MHIASLALAAAGTAILSGTVQAQKPPLSAFKCTQGDCRNGFGVQEHASGFRYAGQFADGARAGLGVETIPNGIRYAGNFARSVPDGFGVMLFPEGERMQAGEWADDFPHGCGLSQEVDQPDAQRPDLRLQFRHVGRWAHGEMEDPEAECYAEINKAHEVASQAFAAAGMEPYQYVEETPRVPLTKEEVLDNLEAMQRGVLQLINEVSDQAAAEEMDEVERLSEALHTAEMTFVKMWYAARALVGDTFDPLFSRDALESVIFETMLGIDEATVGDTTKMQEQLAAMEADLEAFPSEDEQNILLLQKHVDLTLKAVADHRAKGELNKADEAEERLAELQVQLGDLQAQVSASASAVEDQVKEL